MKKRLNRHSNRKTKRRRKLSKVCPRPKSTVRQTNIKRSICRNSMQNWKFRWKSIRMKLIRWRSRNRRSRKRRKHNLLRKERLITMNFKWFRKWKVEDGKTLTAIDIEVFSMNIHWFQFGWIWIEFKRIWIKFKLFIRDSKSRNILIFYMEADEAPGSEPRKLIKTD